MQLRNLKIAVLAAVASTGLGCGNIDLPMVLALAQDGSNTITMDLAIAGAPPDGTPDATIDLEGGAATTMSLDLGDLFKPGGILAMITVDDVQFAGPSVLFPIIPGVLEIPTGTLCVRDLPGGGGTALLRPLRSQVAFDLTLATGIFALGLYPAVSPDPFPFDAVISDTFPLSFSDLIALAFGGDSDFAVTQNISTTLEGLTGTLALINGSQVDASLTLETADALPTGVLLDECNAAGLPY